MQRAQLPNTDPVSLERKATTLSAAKAKHAPKPLLLLVDFKFDGKKAHIVEFGCGINSSYTGYAALHNDDGSILYRKAYEKLGESYKTVTLVSKYPLWNPQSQELMTKLTEKKGNRDKYKALCVGRYAGMGFTEFIDPEKLEEKERTELLSLTENDCIVIPGQESQECMDYATRLESFLRQHHCHARVVNSADSINGLVNNKVLYAVFGGSDLLPTELIDLKKINADKVQRFQRIGKKIVIKPTNASGGNGVIVTTPEKLGAYLELVSYLQSFNAYNLSYNEQKQVIREKAISLGIEYDIGNDKSLDYWFDQYSENNYSENTHFVLLQEFQEATLVDGYNATGRMVFTIEGDTIQFVDGYWKLPLVKQDTNLSKMYVSEIHLEKDAANSRLLSKEEKQLIENSLRPSIAMVVQRAQSQPLVQHIKQMKNSNDADIVSYATILERQFRNSLKAPAITIDNSRVTEKKSNEEKTSLLSLQQTPEEILQNNAASLLDLLSGYRTARDNDIRETYGCRLFSCLKYKKQDKLDAVDFLMSLITATNIAPDVMLETHQNVLRNGELGKKIRAFAVEHGFGTVRNLIKVANLYCKHTRLAAASRLAP